jgi:Flp pilus assembly protein TadD
MIYCSSGGRSVALSAVCFQNDRVGQLPRSSSTIARRLTHVLLAGVAALALTACASNRASMGSTDYTALRPSDVQSTLGQLASRYKQNPRDKTTIVYYSAALRANGQATQAVAVIEGGMREYGRDPDVRVAYAKALAAAGRFEQALSVVDDSINPAQPDWNALSVKGAILDQMGRNREARGLYQQALKIAPGESSLYANLGLSYAMTNELTSAEAQLQKAVRMRGANSQVRQNLALVIGLQGRFDESRAIFAKDLPPDQVEANMSYIRALLTQQNRWDLIKDAEG